MAIQKNKIKAFLFDMDGTLTDTEPCGPKVMQQSLAKVGIQPNQEEVDLFDRVWRRDGTDMTDDEFFKQILTKYLTDSPDIDTFMEGFYKEYEQAITTAPELTGASDLLQSLHHDGFKIGLVTASTREQALAVLEAHGWEDYFDVVVTQDEFKIKKPDPAGYLLAAEKLGATPEECVVVEDSKNGSLSGKNAGMYVIGVLKGNEHPQDLSATSVVVETLSDIAITLQ